MDSKHDVVIDLFSRLRYQPNHGMEFWMPPMNLCYALNIQKKSLNISSLKTVWHWTSTRQKWVKAVLSSPQTFSRIQMTNGLINKKEPFELLFTQLPSSVSTDLLPVLFFIHGGSFIEGSNRKKPLRLINKDIVLVVGNYRLGSFGRINNITFDYN